MNTLKFIIVENNPILRDTFRSILEKELFAMVIATLNSDEELFYQRNIIDIDIIFINLEVAGRSGFETIKRFLWDFPFLRVVGVNTYYAEQVYLLKLIETGMKGCIDADNIHNEIDEAVDNVMRGQLFFTKRVKDNLWPNRNKLIL